MVSCAVRTLLPGGHRCKRAHVVEAIGQLDDQDPQVLGHRHQHFAHRGRLLRLLGVELDSIELGDAVDDGSDVGAELRLELFESDTGVLDRIVEQGCSDGDVVEPEIGHDPGHGQWMVDVGLAGVALLAAMGVGGGEVGLADQRSRRAGWREW